MKKMSAVFTILVAVIFVLSACGPAATTQAPAPTAAPKISVGMVTDTGGIDDKSFNNLSWQGVQKGISDL